MLSSLFGQWQTRTRASLLTGFFVSGCHKQVTHNKWMPKAKDQTMLHNPCSRPFTLTPTSAWIFKIGLFTMRKGLFRKPKMPILPCKKHYFTKQPRARSMDKASRAACKQLLSEKPNRMPEPADTYHCAPHRPFTACQANKFGQHLQG